ncbi:beta strand repeat-containing protein [Candidatus Poriferisocius sp.]|uniref:beta strand repeat-containing protein n=1 Tax=Candidatus Poriferisocius sp. TaxID=3101276 RepID=UPI003B517AC8
MTITSTTIAVTDDDATPTAITLSVDDNSVAEGDSGTTINVTATVVGSTRFGVAKTVTVSVAGAADTSSVNYVDMASVVDFDIEIPAGAASHTGSFPLTPSVDVIDETDNTITVSGSIAGDSAVTVNSATITLADDDATPTGVTLSVDNNSVAEDGSATQITVTATVDGSTRFGLPKTVAVSVAGHDASSKVQFEAVSDFNIEIAAGADSNTGQFPLNPTDDARATADGEASVTGTVTGDGSVTVTATSVTVANDDEAPAAITATLGVNNSGSVTEGSTLTVTVNLGSNAATNLSVPVRMSTSGSPTASSGDFTLSNSGSVAITSGTNSGTITFTAVDDKIDEDSESLTLEFGSLPAELTAGSPNTAAVTITDNDTAGVTVTETGTPADTTVEENEGEDTYTVVLDSKPLKSVIIRVNAELIGGKIAARVEKNNNGKRATYQDLTFTPSNWNQPKPITVRGANNNIDDPGDKRTVTITHTVTEGDNGKYTTSTSINDVTVTVTDDDSGAGVSVSKGAVSVAENSRTDTYDVVLDSQPASSVTVTATSDTPDAAMVNASGDSPAATAALTFTTSNWNQAQTITVTGQNDNIDNTANQRTATINHAITTGAGSDYPTSLTIASVTATVTDDDAAPTGIILSASPNTVAEGADATTVTVTARVNGTTRYADAKTVTVSVAGHNTNGKVQFTPVTNFNITIPAGAASQTDTFDLTPTDDSTDTADGEASLTGTVTGGGSVTPATITITDDDGAGVSVSNGAVSVAEGGGMASYRVKLDSQPASSVTVTATSDTPDAAKVHASGGSPATTAALTFTTSNWNQAQTITVTGQNDNIDNTANQRTATINHAITTGAGSDYPTSLTIASVTATVTDDDAAPTGIILSASPNTVAEGADATTVTVTARVNGTTRYADAKTVTVSVAGHNTNGKVAFTQVNNFDITIPAGQASRTHTFTLTPTDDSTDTANGEASVTGTMTGGGSVTPATITITDDDGAGVSVSNGAVSVAEGGGTASYRVVLDSQPASSVTVTAASDALGAAKVNASGGSPAASAALTFTTSNWSQPQTITVTGQNDDIDNTGDQRTAAINHAITTGDRGNYPTNLNIASVTATVTDDDDPPTGITLSASPTTIAEDDGNTTVTVTARVNGTTRYPDDKTVTVSIAGHNTNGKVQFTQVNGFHITIPAGQPIQTGYFTLTPTDDSTDTADGEASVTGTVTSGGSVTVTATTITITDDEGAPTSITLSIDGGGVATEGGTRRITATLEQALTPPAALTIPIRRSSDSTASASDYSLPSSITIAPGARTATLELTATDDSSDEPTETLTIQLGALPANLRAGSAASVTATIRDNDPTTVRLTRTGASTISEASGKTTIYVTLGRSLQPSERINVPLRITGAGITTADYALSAKKGTGINTGVTLANARTPTPVVVFSGDKARTATLELTATDDSSDEPTETLTIQLGALPANLRAGSAASVTATIRDNDPTTVRLTRTGASTISEASGKTTIYVTLGRSLQPSERINVPLRITGAGITTADYALSAKKGTGINTGVTLANARTPTPVVVFSGDKARTATLELTATDDSSDEPTETLTIQLGALPANLRAGSAASVTATIRDNDPTTVRLTRTGASTISEASGKTTIYVTLGRSLQPSERINVPLRITGAGITTADYALSAKKGTGINTGVTLANARTPTPVVVFSGDKARTATLELTATDDSSDEPTETLTIQLGALPANLRAGSAASVTATIRDNDPTTVRLTRTGASTISEASGKTTIYVTLGRSLQPSERINVPLRITGAGITTADYALSAKKGTGINTGVTLANARTPTPVVVFSGDKARTATLELTATDDSSDEPTETLTIALGSNSDFGLQSSTNVGGGADPHDTANQAMIVINDDDQEVEAQDTDDGDETDETDDGDETDETDETDDGDETDDTDDNPIVVSVGADTPTSVEEGQSAGQRCYEIYGIGYGDWYSPDGQYCVLVNYFPNTHPAHGNAVKAWIEEHPDQYQHYIVQASTSNYTPSQAPEPGQSIAHLLAAGQSCYEIYGIGYGDWYSPDGQSCVLVNYFPNTHPAHGSAVKAWIEEYPDQYQHYLDQAS